MTSAEFIKYVIDYCGKHKISLSLSFERSDCTGYFHHNPPEIYVDINRGERLWFCDLLHEWCHAQQWVENYQPYWESSKFSLLEDPNNWNKHSKDDLKKMLAIYRDVEVDCEKRAVKYIQEFKLPIDSETYIQNANAVIYHYNMMIDYGWNCKSPCEFDEIVDAMPKNMSRSYKNTPTWLKKMYKKVYGF